MVDFYGEGGCCLTCDEEQKERYALEPPDEGCLCPECKCRQCDNYELREDGEGGECTLAGIIKEQREVGFLVDKVSRETPKAYLVDMGGLEMWFPKAVVKLRKGKHGMEIGNASVVGREERVTA